MTIVKLELRIAIVVGFLTEMIAKINAPTFTNPMTYIIETTKTYYQGMNEE
jgi:hypothetical protein